MQDEVESEQQTPTTWASASRGREVLQKAVRERGAAWQGGNHRNGGTEVSSEAKLCHLREKCRSRLASTVVSDCILNCTSREKEKLAVRIGIFFETEGAILDAELTLFFRKEVGRRGNSLENTHLSLFCCCCCS